MSVKAIAELPAWLRDKAGPPTPRAERSAPLVDEDDPAAVVRATAWLRDSAPDHGTFAVACRVKDFGISEPMCGELMLEHWRDARNLGKSDEHVLFRVGNAYRYGSSPVGVASPEAEFEAVEVVDRRTVATALPVRNILSDGWKPFQNYLIKGLVNFGMVGFVAGAKNAGKSPLLLDLAAHVAKGEPWLGHRVKRAYVLYVATEGWTGIGNRLAAVRKVYFPDSEEVAIDYLAASIDLRTSPKSARAIAATARERAKVFGLEPGLIIIDTFSHTLAGGDDSNQAEVKPAIANLKLIAAETGAAVLVAHHPTKNGSSGVRGSSTIEDDTDLTIRVEQAASGGKRRVTTPRVKDYGEITPVAFDIRTVELGEDQDGDPITSVVVSWRPSAEEEFDDKIPEGDREALDALRDTLCRKGTTNATYGEWFATYCSVRGGSTTERGMKPRFNRSRTNLANQGIVGKDEEDQYVILR